MLKKDDFFIFKKRIPMWLFFTNLNWKIITDYILLDVINNQLGLLLINTIG